MLSFSQLSLSINPHHEWK
uniref:Uncharacterized protein n=1 Tax=Arundo donax TaxID=35708 RepID=A0A0A9FTS2_ARUDO